MTENEMLRTALRDLLIAVDFCGSTEFPPDILQAARDAVDGPTVPSKMLPGGQYAHTTPRRKWASLSRRQLEEHE